MGGYLIFVGIFLGCGGLGRLELGSGGGGGKGDEILGERGACWGSFLWDFMSYGLVEGRRGSCFNRGEGRRRGEGDGRERG